MMRNIIIYQVIFEFSFSTWVRCHQGKRHITAQSIWRKRSFGAVKKHCWSNMLIWIIEKCVPIQNNQNILLWTDRSVSVYAWTRHELAWHPITMYLALKHSFLISSQLSIQRHCDNWSVKAGSQHFMVLGGSVSTRVSNYQAMSNYTA